MDEIKVLSIDDEESIRYALTAVIESQGWISFSAENIKEAIEIIKKERPTIILVDYHMPVINGLDGVKMIREIEKDTPIIVFTIDSDQEVADKFMDAGANDFATKPIKGPDLISRINLHIQLLENADNSEEKLTDSLDLPKGIGLATLNLIIEKMRDRREYMTVEEISELSSISYQTTYRYLQFMTEEDLIDVKIHYGKIGRPKQSYILKENI